MKNYSRKVRVDFEENRRTICSLLRRHHGLSRQQISDMTGLHRSTVSKVITEYLHLGVATEKGKIEPGQKRVGKKQMLVRIQDAAGWSLGIAIHRGHADFTVVGASGAAIQSSALDFNCPLDEIPIHLARHIESWLADKNAPQGKCAAVGIGIHARVERHTGCVLHWPEYSVQRYPMAQDWAKYFSTPIFVYNSTCAESLCEIKNPVRPENESFVYIHLDCRPAKDGFSVTSSQSSIVIQGALYAGAQGNAGRFRGKMNHESSVQLSEKELKMIGQPDSGLTPNLDAMASELADLVAGTAGLLDIDRLILGGHVVPLNPDFLDLVNMRVRRALDAGDGTPTPKVHPSRFVSPTAAHCAGLMAFDHSPTGCRIHASS